MLLLWPHPPPPALVRCVDLAGYAWKAAAGDAGAGTGPPVTEGSWAAAVVSAEADPEGAVAFCRALRRGNGTPPPLLLVVGAGHLPALDVREQLWDDFCLSPLEPQELELRLAQLLWRAGRSGGHPELVEHGGLVLNRETYQAAVAGRPLDLTYMEYELLKFLATHPGKVFTREALLSQVWGYEYYGGARTVDVHIRRLRAKLGEEHAGLIGTVRSVGYRFGQARWGAGTA